MANQPVDASLHQGSVSPRGGERREVPAERDQTETAQHGPRRHQECSEDPGGCPPILPSRQQCDQHQSEQTELAYHPPTAQLRETPHGPGWHGGRTDGTGGAGHRYDQRMAAYDAAEYFELHCRDYHPRPLRVALRWIGNLLDEDDDLFDVGCGTGLMLEAMSSAGVTHLAGCDTASAALKVAAERVDFTPHLGSILDDDFVEGLGDYRFVTVTAVLHHVVGSTRRSSRVMAETAVRNALTLVRPGGRLVIMEPTYRPRWAMTALFWAKRALGALIGNRRCELGRWNNLGAPLVSFYSPDEVVAIVEAAGGRVIRRRDRTARLRCLPRLLGIRDRWFTTVMAARGRENAYG